MLSLDKEKPVVNVSLPEYTWTCVCVCVAADLKSGGLFCAVTTVTPILDRGV